MPEGDSLVRLAHRLRPVMQDHVVLRSDFRTPSLATVDFAGWTVTRIWPTAKYLSMRLTPPQDIASDRQNLVVLSHLGMDGAWQVDTRLSHHTRCVLVFDDHTVVGHRLAKLEVLPPNQAQQRVAFLGPDLLDPAWETFRSEDLIQQAVQNFRQAPDQPIATALLDQRLVAGIGNIYRCEVLFLAGINPHTRLRALTDEQLVGLIMLARDLMVLNVPPRAPARTRRRTVDIRPDDTNIFRVRVATELEQARTAADRRRAVRDPNFWVYGRQRQDCLRCGGPVRVDQLGTAPTLERDVYWCPKCQPKNGGVGDV